MGNRRGYKGRDTFGQQAHEQGFEARSIFKLEEIQRRFRLLAPGDKVVDLGCFPGSWSQFCLKVVGYRGKVVGVDLSRPTISGAHWIERSVYDVTAEELLEALGGPADVLVSDMAPNTTGNSDADHYVQIELARRALQLAGEVVKPGGHFVSKVFEGPDGQLFDDEVKAMFRQHKRVRPPAVRSRSREFFVVGRERR